MEANKEPAKLLITNAFKKLMIGHDFDKITIKMIADEAGIIRPTFYRHFQDKCDVLEWIVQTQLIEKAEILLEGGMNIEAVTFLFNVMLEERPFYRKAFMVTGQNGFAEMLTHKISLLFIKQLDAKALTMPNGNRFLTKEVVAVKYAMDLSNTLSIWVKNAPSDASAIEAAQAYVWLATHSLIDLFGLDKQK
jgi:Transcriptional regulator